MDRPLAKIPASKPPLGLAKLFNDPPLLGSESREEYDGLFSAIIDALKPQDAIAWLFVRDYTDLSWEIRRERRVKAQIVESARNAVVVDLLTPVDLSAFAAFAPSGTNLSGDRTDLIKWQKDPKSRPAIEKRLADRGDDESVILAKAYIQAAADIDAIDRRIASYERRRMAALTAVEAYSEKFARRLQAASSEVIDGEFTEAAE